MSDYVIYHPLQSHRQIGSSKCATVVKMLGRMPAHVRDHATVVNHDFFGEISAPTFLELSKRFGCVNDSVRAPYPPLDKVQWLRELEKRGELDKWGRRNLDKWWAAVLDPANHT